MGLSPFARRVIAAVRRIPHGRVATYGDIAAAAGRPRAHRAVGTLLRTLQDPSLPAHRVIAAGGRLGGFGGDPDLKAQRLRSEGIVVVNSRIRRFGDIRVEGKGQRAKGRGTNRDKGKGKGERKKRRGRAGRPARSPTSCL
ncbi:MAG TPA: MGMT family protein [Vicinamibacterales bacterium]